MRNPGGQSLADLPPEKRDRLVHALGQHGAEAALLGARPGRVLWTDDHITGLVAAQECGARRIWTQAALQARTAAGMLDVVRYGDAVAKLVGWGYHFTSIDASVVVRAGLMAGWDVGRWPFRQVLDQFADEGIDIRGLLALAAAGLVQVHRHVDSPVGRDIVTIGLLERLGSRRLGPIAVQMLADLIPKQFGLNVVRGVEATRVVDAWLATLRPGLWNA